MFITLSARSLNPTLEIMPAAKAEAPTIDGLVLNFGKAVDGGAAPAMTGTGSLSVILCARHNQREGAYYAEQSEEGIS